MFEGRFSEILLIFVLALVVLGPEKLPRVAAEVGRWVGRARAMARQFREQLEEEVTLAEAAAKSKQPATLTPTVPAQAEPTPYAPTYDSHPYAASGSVTPPAEVESEATPPP